MSSDHIHKIDRNAPDTVARYMLFNVYGQRLVYQGRRWFSCRNELSDAEIRAQIYKFLNGCEDLRGRPVKPNMRMVSAVMRALRAMVREKVAPQRRPAPRRPMVVADAKKVAVPLHSARVLRFPDGAMLEGGR